LLPAYARFSLSMSNFYICSMAVMAEHVEQDGGNDLPSCFPYSAFEIGSSFRESHVLRRLHELTPEFWRGRIREPQIFKFIQGKLHLIVAKTLFEAAERCPFSARSKHFGQLIAGRIQMPGRRGPASF
jgi:hypothetical protein